MICSKSVLNESWSRSLPFLFLHQYRASSVLGTWTDLVLVQETDELLTKFQCWYFCVRCVGKISAHDVPAVSLKTVHLLLHWVDFINKRYKVNMEWPFYRNFFSYLFNFRPQLNPHLANRRSCSHPPLSQFSGNLVASQCRHGWQQPVSCSSHAIGRKSLNSR